jgi:hypothetical protein
MKTISAEQLRSVAGGLEEYTWYDGSGGAVWYELGEVCRGDDVITCGVEYVPQFEPGFEPPNRGTPNNGVPCDYQDVADPSSMICWA